MIQYPQLSRWSPVPSQINTAEFRVVETGHITTLQNKSRRNIADMATSCEFPFTSWIVLFPQTCVFRQAITTGLVNSCAMCKQRPRRTGERVCGRTCRERDRQATQIQG